MLTLWRNSVKVPTNVCPQLPYSSYLPNSEYDIVKIGMCHDCFMAAMDSNRPGRRGLLRYLPTPEHHGIFRECLECGATWVAEVVIAELWEDAYKRSVDEDLDFQRDVMGL